MVLHRMAEVRLSDAVWCRRILLPPVFLEVFFRGGCVGMADWLECQSFFWPWIINPLIQTRSVPQDWRAIDQGFSRSIPETFHWERRRCQAEELCSSPGWSRVRSPSIFLDTYSPCLQLLPWGSLLWACAGAQACQLLGGDRELNILLECLILFFFAQI